jgi:hypothetical protein
MHQIEKKFPVITFVDLKLEVSGSILVLLPEVLDLDPFLIELFGHPLHLQLFLLELSIRL